MVCSQVASVGPEPSQYPTAVQKRAGNQVVRHSVLGFLYIFKLALEESLLCFVVVCYVCYLVRWLGDRRQTQPPLRQQHPLKILRLNPIPSPPRRLPTTKRPRRRIFLRTARLSRFPVSATILPQTRPKPPTV